jgi:transcriptional regulator with XRE-family HTH domain
MVTPPPELARTLRERRRSLGLTRTKLAERSGLTSTDLAAWERGERFPDPGQIVVLAEAVGLDDAQTRAWLDAAVTVDLTGPEVAVSIVEGQEPPANPFSRRLEPLREDSHRFERLRARVESIRNDITGTTVSPLERSTERTAPAPMGLVAAPPRPTERDFPSVFPDSHMGNYDPSIRVYSTAAATFPGPDDEQVYMLRRLRTAAVLLGLGIVLWWAVGALGEGIGDVLDLFRTTQETVLLP